MKNRSVQECLSCPPRLRLDRYKYLYSTRYDGQWREYYRGDNTGRLSRLDEWPGRMRRKREGDHSATTEYRVLINSLSDHTATFSTELESRVRAGSAEHIGVYVFPYTFVSSFDGPWKHESILSLWRWHDSRFGKFAFFFKSRFHLFIFFVTLIRANALNL